MDTKMDRRWMEHSCTTTRLLLLLLSLLPVLVAQNKELSYTIYEEGPVPSMVGNIARDSNVSQLLGSDVFATLRLVWSERRLGWG